MAFVLPVEQWLAAPGGVPDAATEAQLSALDGAVKRAAETGELHKLRQAAEGLFRGGEIPDLGSPDSDAKVKVTPVKHLKAAMVLTMAALETDGLPGFSDGLTLIEQLLSTQWETVHPLANPDDEEDPYIQRVNAISPLYILDPAKAAPQTGAVISSDSWGIEPRLLKTGLLQSDRHGTVSLRDCLSPWAKALKITLPPGEDREPVFIHEARLAAVGPALDGQRQAAQAALTAVEGIDAAFKKVPGEIKPKLDYLTRLLRAAGDVLEDKTEVPAGPAGPKPPRPSNGDGGPVSSREEAVRKLAEVAEYFRRNEPASPIPALLDRAKRLAGMNFLALLEELGLGDQAVPEFRKLAGLREATSNGETGATTESAASSEASATTNS
jgi:type VI secretion system protein ImpA